MELERRCRLVKALDFPHETILEDCCASHRELQWDLDLKRDIVYSVVERRFARMAMEINFGKELEEGKDWILELKLDVAAG